MPQFFPIDKSDGWTQAMHLYARRKKTFQLGIIALTNERPGNLIEMIDRRFWVSQSTRHVFSRWTIEHQARKGNDWNCIWKNTCVFWATICLWKLKDKNTVIQKCKMQTSRTTKIQKYKKNHKKNVWKIR